MVNRKTSRRSFMKSVAAGVTAGSIARTAAAENANCSEYKEVYEPTWESVDSHPCPEWFHDAKVGMYFHWGVSAVPGWAPREGGTPYAEWYWYAMNDKDNPTWRYHRETYGEQFGYDYFIPLFKAERYNPEGWIDFAQRAGANYVFMNTKHHDGFCLWPSRVTDRTAYKMGPKKDIIGPFVYAARNENLKVGFYYSFYEWYNPLYTGTPHPYAGLISVDDYVNDFMIPQVKELIDWYHPDFLYLDGEWDHPPDFWKSKELVAYYYNQAREREQDVLVNDRFGKGSRGNHGDVYNVEYEYNTGSKGLLTHKWSYWRGIGKTFGYNRDTSPGDCLTTRELIHMIVDGVSKNGNFDINVGPTADGIITNVEKEPLTGLGEWLRVNGEAIYGTRVCKVTEENDVRFTAKGDYVYALFLQWRGEKFHIKSVRAAEGSKISMLGVPGDLSWHQDENGLTIEYPLFKSRPTNCAYAWAFKIRVKT